MCLVSRWWWGADCLGDIGVEGEMVVLGTVWCAAEGMWTVVSYLEGRVGLDDRDVLGHSR